MYKSLWIIIADGIVKVEVFLPLVFPISNSCGVSRVQFLSDLYSMVGFALAFLFASLRRLSVYLSVCFSFWPLYRHYICNSGC